MGDIIKLNKPATYNLRIRQELYRRDPKTVTYGTESISFLAPKIWAIVPQNIKNCTSLLSINPLSANPTIKQFVCKLPTNYLTVFEYFVELALKGLR